MPDGALAARAAAGEKTLGGAAVLAAPPVEVTGHRGVARHVGGGRSARRHHHRPVCPSDGKGVAARGARGGAARGRDAAPGGARAVGDGPMARRAAHAGVPMTGMSEARPSTAGAEGPEAAER